MQFSRVRTKSVSDSLMMCRLFAFSMFFTHLFAWPCGSTISGQRRALLQRQTRNRQNRKQERRSHRPSMCVCLPGALDSCEAPAEGQAGGVEGGSRVVVVVGGGPPMETQLLTCSMTNSAVPTSYNCVPDLYPAFPPRVINFPSGNKSVFQHQDHAAMLRSMSQSTTRPHRT